MSSKLLVIIATGEKEKAITGLMYAKNALKNEWLKDIRVIFFGPSEKLMVEDEDVSNYALEISQMTDCLACKFISDRDEITESIEEKGVKAEYVGSIISEYIEEGYVPMVW